MEELALEYMMKDINKQNKKNKINEEQRLRSMKKTIKTLL